MQENQAVTVNDKLNGFTRKYYIKIDITYIGEWESKLTTFYYLLADFFPANFKPQSKLLVNCSLNNYFTTRKWSSFRSYLL